MTSANYRWLVGLGSPIELHVAMHDVRWQAPRECFGGMGGQPDGGFRALCGAWGVVVSDATRTAPVCRQCTPFAAAAGSPT